jgi:putative oxidoreductase
VHIAAIVLQILLALMFLMAGFSKFKDKRQVEAFEHYGYPQWFRIVTGIVELVGAIGMIVGIWYPMVAHLAGVWLGITMLVAVITHIRAKDPAKMVLFPAILFVLNALVALLQWHGLAG